ncbi:contractile injection system tape measure protein [Arthrobacter sp. JSM 101049]|uniref:contractile injection system tape measure protein n=1 Tax=Arthrobacter sp. JSM 101049 TaxID=929097 RepID=UPI00356B3E34
MTDIAVDVLRLRGPGSGRLARVAATTLPPALEAALTGLSDATLTRIGVRLEVDPTEYDDDTLAILWAQSIRAGILEATGGRTVPGTRPGPAGASTSLSSSMPKPMPIATGPEAVAAAARRWVAAGDDTGPAIPLLLFALAGPGVAPRVRDLLGPSDWRRLTDRLAALLGPPPPSHGRTDAPEQRSGPTPPPAAEPAPPPGPKHPSVHPADEPSNRPGHPRPVSAAEPPTSGAVSGAEARAQRRHPGREPDSPNDRLPDRLPDRLAVLAALAALDGPSLADPVPTRVGGLVLLYPWLADHCRAAEALHPGLDVLDVREAALAAIVDPGHAATADDPLIGLLAGRPPGRTPHDRQREPLPYGADVTASALGVLAGFTALLPGFTRSSPDFARAQWIERDGLLDTGRDPMKLTAAGRPLDLVLGHLPYPVGLVKLPWSPALAVVIR